MGVPAGEDTSRLQRLTAFFDSIGFPYVVPADIRTHMWSKLLCNTGCNQARPGVPVRLRPAGRCPESPGTP